MPKKPNSHGNDQEYVPAGNGDASGEYADEKGSNWHFENFGSPSGESRVSDSSVKTVTKTPQTNKIVDNASDGNDIANNVRTYYESGQFGSMQEVIDWGKQNGVDVKNSATTLSKPQALKAFSQIKALKNEFNIDTISLVGENSGGNDIAFVRTRAGSKDLTLSCCRWSYNDYQEKDFVDLEIKSRNDKWNPDFDDEYAAIYSVTHEFGHLIEHTWLNNNDFQKESAKILNDAKNTTDFRKKIQKARYDRFEQPFLKEVFETAKKYDSTIQSFDGKNAPFISKYGMTVQYGRTQWREYIAEAFANGMLGRPTAIGRATVEVAKKWMRGKTQ